VRRNPKPRHRELLTMAFSEVAILSEDLQDAEGWCLQEPQSPSSVRCGVWNVKGGGDAERWRVGDWATVDPAEV
jgi:hypothetical protein